MILEKEHDPLGTAILAVHLGKKVNPIRVKNRYGTDEEMDPYYLFRSFQEMPELEQRALQEVNGDVLDIGAGAGSHSLYLLKKGLNCAALEYSAKACEVMKMRGVQQVYNQNVWDHRGKYDSLLLMMNGIGLVGDIPGLRKFLAFADGLLNPGGSIIFDSCDVSYVYKHSPVPEGRYYGEIEFKMQFEEVVGPWFKWLFVDPVLMEHEAQKAGWKFELLEEDNSFQYLAKLSKA